MVDQKGFDLIAALAERLWRFDAALGHARDTGEPRYQDDVARRSQRRHPGPRRRSRIGFDEWLAHLIEGGCRSCS